MKLLIVFALLTTVYCAVPWEPASREGTWITKHEHLLNQTKAHANEVKVVFLGDSITEFWATNGKAVWAEHYAPRGAFNYGIGGDRTEQILWRIAHGELDGVAPKLVVLMIGTNNLNNSPNIGANTAADIAKAIHTILDALYTKISNAKVLLLSILPRLPEQKDQRVHDVNALISRFADNKRTHYLDLAVHFEISFGHEIAELYNADSNSHLSVKGYEMWHKVMEPSFKALIA